MKWLDDLLQLVEQDDYCSLPMLVGLLVYIGQRLVADRSQLRVWGFRLSVVVLIAYSTFRAWDWPLPAAGELVVIVVRGLFASGLVLGAAWILLPIIVTAYQLTVGAGLHWLGSRWTRFQTTRDERKLRRQFERERRRAEWEFQQQGPKRERERREADRRAQHEQKAQVRRERARGNCELLYGLLAPEIGDRFPRALFDAFLDKYLSDCHDPEYVEQWAQQLQAMLRQHSEKVQPTPKFQSLEAIAHWFHEQKQTIEALSVDDRTKRTMMTNLRTKYDELTTRFLEELA
ncbi:MAG: hypothetical protein AB7K24_32255 [Gemmataceae bacterium]